MVSIYYEHSDFWVFSKPEGVSINDGPQNSGFISLQKRIIGATNIHPVHRLDKATSGLLLAAKHSEANRALSLEFQNRQVHKVYVALIRPKAGKKAKKKQGWIVGDMKPTRGGNWKLMRTADNPAKTYFRTVSLSDRYRLAFLYPVTGKTHQLRVAMKANTIPIVGDDRYGGEPADRLYLHACGLRFSYKNESLCFCLLPERSGLFSLCSESFLHEHISTFFETVNGLK